ncbi:hypothetical protein Pla52n_18670 [Stieleria varia]|uniref:Uncharacterized protein n=1 Tax=Stieleria varia TaxID=2528005 RepID=A0A5C6B2V4_9BACT|nr:hypothetical protein Pla52n_18670 [Stieleria varia]
MAGQNVRRPFNQLGSICSDVQLSGTGGGANKPAFSVSPSVVNSPNPIEPRCYLTIQGDHEVEFCGNGHDATSA